jgi:hypothetical protein
MSGFANAVIIMYDSWHKKAESNVILFSIAAALFSLCVVETWLFRK